MSDLLPCPWPECDGRGVDVYMVFERHGESEASYVVCDICKCRGPVEFDEDQATRRWNAPWELLERKESQ